METTFNYIVMRALSLIELFTFRKNLDILFCFRDTFAWRVLVFQDKNYLFPYQTRTTEWFNFFFSKCTS